MFYVQASKGSSESKTPVPAKDCMHAEVDFEIASAENRSDRGGMQMAWYWYVQIAKLHSPLQWLVEKRCPYL